ncbi:terminase [Corynebacterium heidelbergense]|nr:terminase [Corynebacterium heidelbergense]
MSEAVPRFHTPRDYRRRTLGAKAAKLSAMMGRACMPWQRQALDVALEVDDRGRFHYKTVVITVPRQSGKTALVLAAGLHRTLITPNGKVWYTAQTGQIARERFLEDMAVDAERLLSPTVAVKRGAGDTRLIFPAIHSQFRPHPPTDTSLHSEQSDLNLIDEPWAFSEVQGDGLIQAIQPTQNTRPNAQTIYLSTMGDARSTWWHAIVDAARAAEDPHTAIIDWGLPEGHDPSDIEAVIRAHPAVGHTIEPETVRTAAGRMKPAEFARAYANVRTQTRVAVFSSDVLARVLTETATMAPAAEVAFGVATAFDRSISVIAAAGEAADGTPVCEIVDARPGTGWVADRLTELQRHHPRATLVDARSPASTIATDPALTEIISTPASAELAGGTGLFLDSINRAELRLRYDRDLARSFDGLTLKFVGDLGQMLDRKHSSGSIAHIEACLLAFTAIAQRPAPAPTPEIWTC